MLATLPGAVVHDISFATSQIGYAAAELGQVWKTTNGGAELDRDHESRIPLLLVRSASLAKDNDVVVSGFNDSNFEGIIRYSQDGGQTWTSDIILDHDRLGQSHSLRQLSRRLGDGSVESQRCERRPLHH